MAGEWLEVKLGEIADLVRGVSYRPADLLPDGSNGIPLLRATNITNSGLDLADVLFVPSELVRPNQMLRRYDVVIAMSSGSREAVGRLAQLRQDWVGCFGAFCGVIRADPRRVHPDFLGFVLQSPNFRTRIETHAVGTAIMNLSRERILGFSLELPPLTEQRAIAHVLGTLDDKIELNRRMSQTLEAMARALFKSWFVDFDPVRWKMERKGAKAQSRNQSQTALASSRLGGFALPPALAALFPDRFVDSELGPIPEGWKVGTLADLSVLNPEVWTRQTRPAKIIYVDLSNAKWGRIDLLTAYDSADAPSRAQRVLRPGDTIVGTVRPGNGSYAFIAEGGLTGSTGFAALRPRAAHYAELVYLAATAPDNIDRLAHLADGAAYPAVRPEVVAATPVVCPSDEVLARFSQAAGLALAKIAQNERESRTLAALRDALLPKLISGEIRVKEAERFLQERGL